MNSHQNSLSHNTQHGFTSDITINAPKEKAWAVLGDFNNVYSWAPGVSKSYALGDKQQQVGASRSCTLSDFGSIDEVVTEWKQGEGFTYTVSPLGPLHNAINRWTLIEIDAGTTRLTVEFAYDIRFSVFGKLMHSLVMRKKLLSSLPDTLSAFKHRVETGELVRPLIDEPPTSSAQPSNQPS